MLRWRRLLCFFSLRSSFLARFRSLRSFRRLSSSESVSESVEGDLWRFDLCFLLDLRSGDLGTPLNKWFRLNNKLTYKGRAGAFGDVGQTLAVCASRCARRLSSVISHSTQRWTVVRTVPRMSSTQVHHRNVHLVHHIHHPDLSYLGTYSPVASKVRLIPR